MEIHKDLERIKVVAVLQAVEHRCNYNLIIHNHVDGLFDAEKSTYEIVRDSYLEKESPHAHLLYKTDDMLENLSTYFDEGMVRCIKKKQVEMNNVKAFANPPYLIKNPYPADRYETVNKPDQVIKEKVPNRNDKCPCGSGIKYKHCCLK